MKKSLFQRRSVFHQISRRSYFLLAGMMVVVVLGALLFNGPFAFSRVLFDMGSTGSNLFSVMPNIWTDRALLTARIDALTRERDLLQEKYAQLDSRMSLTQTADDVADDLDATMLGVISRPPVAPYDYFLIAKDDKSYAPGDFVFSLGETPLGVVEQVNAKTLLVRLYSTGGYQNDAYVGEDKHHLTLIGRGAGAFIATISKDIPVAVGDTIYLSAPDMRPIGLVAHVITNETEPEALVTIRPYVNIFNQSYVRVLHRFDHE